MGKKKAVAKKAPAAAPAAPAAAGANTQVLPKKEDGLFKELIRLQESKQYKKAIKTADTVLKKFPEHGETNAMKGLVYNSMGEKDKAYELAKLGVRYNIKSAVCWHVYGMIYRSDKNYKEAIKCFQMAVRFNPNNLQIVRELSVLQIQIRDMPGFTASRLDLVRQQGGLRSNWLGYSLGQHLSGNLKMAITILDQYLTTLPAERDASYEESEILMYKLQILEEIGDKQAALDHLDRHFYDILDRNAWLEKKVELLLALGRSDEARQLLTLLIKRNPENYMYHRDLQACALGLKNVSKMENSRLPADTMELSEEQIAALQQEYEDLFGTVKRKPTSVGRIPMGYLQGEAFRTHADGFLRQSMRKGVPSLFSSLRPIYKMALRNNIDVSESIQKQAMERVQILGELVEGYVKSLDATSELPALEGDSVKEKESPTMLLWALFFLAQHYDMMSESDKALATIERAIEHTPTTLDLFVVKARILKHMGDFIGAAAAMESGRELDLADKWINSKATKYLLRAGQIDKAEDVVGLFTKHEGDSRGYLKEMQAVWFEIEIARSFKRIGDLQLALKFYAAIVEHYDDFEEDQLEFHLYCLRKATMRAYVSTIRYEDHVRGHPAYGRAAKGVIDCLLELHDKPAKYSAVVEKAKKDAPSKSGDGEEGSSGGAKKSSEDSFAGMSAAEKKKAKAKARKEEAKRKQEEESGEKKEGEDEGEDKAKRSRVATDEDPKGAKLLAKYADSPLEEAHKLCEVLRKFAPSRLDTQLCIFDVEVRRGKYLQALRALCCAVDLAPGGAKNPAVFSRLAPFVQLVQSSKVTYAPWAGKSTSDEDVNVAISESVEIPESVRTAVESHAASLIDGSPSDAASAFFKENSGSPSISSRVAAAVAMIRVDAQVAESAEKTLTSIVGDLPESAFFQDLSDMHEELTGLGASQSLLDDLKASILKKFPHGSLEVPSPDFGKDTKKKETEATDKEE